jgi:hypothetical protein
VFDSFFELDKVKTHDNIVINNYSNSDYILRNQNGEENIIVGIAAEPWDAWLSTK